MTTQTSNDPAAIERDIRQTQEDMSRTVDKIGDQLTPRNIIDALLDQADKYDIDARTLLQGARNNPLALAMIAGGAIWLASDSDAKLPKMGSRSEAKPDHADPHHRDYVAHMERVEHRDGEDPAAYQRRRDIARSNYFMVERAHEEDDGSFKQRLDAIADKFRGQRQAWFEQAGHARDAISDSGKAALGNTAEIYRSNPLVGGLIAAAVGAMVGTALPVSELEEEQLSDLGKKARDLAAEQSDKLTDTIREKKDQILASVQGSPDLHAEGNPAIQGTGGNTVPAGT